MIVTNVEAIALPEIPFPKPIAAAWWPGTMWRSLSLTVVRVYTDEGIVGIGAGGLRSATTIREHVGPALVGQDPTLIEKHISLLRRMGHAWGVEMALWDLLGKVAGLPLYRLWGGYTDRVKAYASLLEMGSPGQRAEDALRLLQEGFRAIKLRIHHDTMRDDIALVQAVRGAVGDRMEIMVDANQADLVPGQEVGPVWSLQRAIWTAKALEELDVTWLEEPLGRHDLDAIAQLCRSVEVPIAGGENNRSLRDFARMVKTGAYDILQPEVMVCGIAGARKVAALAEAAGMPTVCHHGGNGLGLLTHLHMSGSCPNIPIVEYFYDPPSFPTEVFQGLLHEPVVVDPEGYLHLPQKPGLGVELSEGYIERYRA